MTRRKTRRIKKIPRWQGILALIVLAVALAENGFFLYHHIKGPAWTEQDNQSCVHAGSWICCKPTPWGTMTELDINRTFTVTSCAKYDPINYTPG